MALDLVPILLLSISVSIGNFFAAIGIGVAGLHRSAIIKILAFFFVFELVMPLVGLAIGSGFSSLFLVDGRYAGAALLFLLGIYNLLKKRNEDLKKAGAQAGISNGNLAVIALMLSLDNLIVGFAFGSYNLPILYAALFIAVISVSLSAIGLEIGKRLGKRIALVEDKVLGAVLFLVALFVLFS